ncbi:MAG: 3-methyl-2-oxobutanoate hydroxymethyltransferase [Planctomycetota bacterium]|nr:3-methyl-2-oxobutanoate hydroxymethyltransferase [Planctomycetota bacterium]
MTPPDAPPGAAVTLRTLRAMAREGKPFAALTCYDATTARWLARAGLHILLVGDTAAEMVLGFPSTIHAPLDFMVTITAAVKRGAPSAFVMADMPFLSYTVDDAAAITNAGRFMVEGLADCVKLEATAAHAPLVEKLTRAGIPVCAHVGSRPQQAGLSGGYAAAGRTPSEATAVVEDAVALERAGAVLLLVEAVPEEVTRRILEETSVPLIGIGAGQACHGQVLVLQDLLGMTDRPPVFAPAIAQLGAALQQAGQEWVRLVAERRVRGHRFEMRGEKPARAGQPGATSPVEQSQLQQGSSAPRPS